MSFSSNSAPFVPRTADWAPPGSGRGNLDEIAIFIQMRICHSLMNERLTRQLEPHALSKVGYLTMLALYRRPDDLANPSELCAATGETRANMTRICDELVDKGLMRRMPNLEDRRHVDLSLTDAGLALLNAIAPAQHESDEAFYKSLFADAERATLQQLLNRFADALADS